MISFLPESFIFLTFVFLFLFLPGRLLFTLLGIKIKEDLFVQGGLYSGVGLVMFILAALLMRITGVNSLFLWVLPLSFLPLISLYRHSPHGSSFDFAPFDIAQNKQDRHDLSSVTPSQECIRTPGRSDSASAGRLQGGWKYIFTSAILALGVLAQAIVLLRGGWQTNSGVIFPSLHDTMWNISLTAEVYHHFPPQHPGMAGEKLKNNHYFYPLFLGEIHRLTHLSVFDLYFRFGPILVSLLFGLSLYTVSSIFTNRQFFRSLSVFLGFFSGNFSYFLPFFLGKNFDWRGNTFFADQPFDQIVNPYSVLGFSLFLFSIYAFAQFTTTRRKRKVHLGWSIIFAMVVGVLYGVKSFGGIIAVLALGTTAVSAFLLDKRLDIFLLSLITSFLFIPIFFFTTDLGKVGLQWLPGWLLREMMIGEDKLNLGQYAQIESYYQQIGNYLGLLKIKLIELVIYTVGNFGVRLLGLIYLLWRFVGLETSLQLNRIVTLFVVASFSFSFFLPILANLKVTPYNIIQFTPYALVLLSIFTSLFIEKLYLWFDKMKRTLTTAVIVLIVVALAVPVNLKNVIEKLPRPQEKISYGKMEALEFLRDNSDINEIVLIDPRTFLTSVHPIHIAAISERRVYLTGTDYPQQTGLDPAARMSELIDFFDGGENGQDFLSANNISYVYLLKSSLSKEARKILFGYGLIPFFENDEILILRYG